MTRETLATFESKVNVDHIITGEGENKKEAWLTKPEGFTATKDRVGGEILDASEDGKRIYFFKEDGELVGDYRLSNGLQGSTPEQLYAKKHCLLFFETWYPAEKRWVKQCAEGTPKVKSAKAIRI
jgi:hypothetical protein